MIISLIKIKFSLKQYKKEQIFMRWVLFNIVTLEISIPYIQIVYQNFIRKNILLCKLVHTSRGNS